MTLQWIACDLQTGDLIMAAPWLIVDYPVRHTLGQYDTATAHFVVEDTSGGASFTFTTGPSPDASVDWWYSTIPGACLLACYDDEDVDQTIQWAGFVITRIRNAEANIVDLSLVTTEAYLDRRFINADVTYDATGQNLVMKNIAEDHIKDGTTDGLPLTITYTVPGDDGAAINQSYRDADLTSVFEAFTALAALTDGPEWEMRWSWRGDMSGLDCTLYIGDHIGIASSTPAAVFEMPGSIISASYVEDYTAGKGANGVRAYPTTMGVSPSDFQTVTDDYGRPRFNYQLAAPDAVSTTAKLNRLALRTVNNMQNGGRAIQLTADRRTSPVFCRDWNLGDDIGFKIGNVSAGQPFIPVFPFTNGLTGHQRVLAVEISEDTIKPIAAGGDG